MLRHFRHAMHHMQSRCICTSATLESISSRQLGKFINKLAITRNTKKSYQKQESKDSDSFALKLHSNYDPPQHKNKRVSILNKIFMTHITDLIASGEVAPQLLEKGINITHVKVAPNYKLIRVFWFSSKQIENESIGNLLIAAAGHLQHELAQLNLIGRVPPIQFVKNKFCHNVEEVENLLSKVDFGVGYEPTYSIDKINNAPTLETRLSTDIKAQISKTENKEICEENIFYEIEMPEMRQDVMGFDHASVMARITTSNKSKKAQKSEIDIRVQHARCEDLSTDVNSFSSHSEEKELFEGFLKNQKLLRIRKQKYFNLKEIKRQEEEWIMQNNDDVPESEIYDSKLDDDYNDFRMK